MLSSVPNTLVDSIIFTEGRPLSTICLSTVRIAFFDKTLILYIQPYPNKCV